MDRIHSLFMEAMGAALKNQAVCWGEDVSLDALSKVLALARAHHVLPMIFEAVHSCPAAAQLDAKIFRELQKAAAMAAMTQSFKTAEFLELYEFLRRRGLKPLVVKGVVCRQLYPNPDYRHSGDEDIFCGTGGFRETHEALLAWGMENSTSDTGGYEVSYRKKDGALHVELHKTLFATSHQVLSEYNDLFSDSLTNAVEITLQGVPVATLEWSEHLLYLLLHAFKHFLHSGFGIRQVCDIVLFANAYGEKINWDWLREQCRKKRAEKFAAAVFKIGKEYLGFLPLQACFPDEWSGLCVDAHPLLEDLLQGGIYGSADRSRVHSSNMTLNAVAASKKGKTAHKSVLRTIFPDASSLEGRFSWLRGRRWLLPVAWCCRIFGYARETIAHPADSAAEAIRTGSRRVDLLRQYDIID